MNDGVTAARAVIAEAKELALILCMVGVLLLRLLLSPQGYSGNERVRLGSAFMAGCSLLVFAVFLDLQGSNILTVMRYYIAWAAFVVAISTFTLTVVGIAFVQHFREARKVYGITEADLPSEAPLWNARVVWSGFAVWVLCCATAIYWLWEIGNSGSRR